MNPPPPASRRRRSFSPPHATAPPAYHGAPMADLQGEQSEFHSERGVFRAEYERELGQWLRRRLGWLCVAYACFQIMATGSIVFALLGQAEAREQLQPRQSLPATSPLEAVGEIAQDIAREVRRDADAKTDDGPKQPIGRLVDRWWEDTIAPITDKTKSESADPEDDDSASRVEPAGSEPASAEPTVRTFTERTRLWMRPLESIPATPGSSGCPGGAGLAGPGGWGAQPDPGNGASHWPPAEPAALGRA